MTRPLRGRWNPASTDHATDTYDTIDWLVKNVPGNNSRVGMWGISYPGFYTSAGMIDAHPALKAVSPQAPIADWFVGDDFHHNGALYLPHAFGFISVFGAPRLPPRFVIERDEEMLKELELTYAILDEAQHIKNPMSAT